MCPKIHIRFNLWFLKFGIRDNTLMTENREKKSGVFIGKSSRTQIRVTEKKSKTKTRLNEES